MTPDELSSTQTFIGFRTPHKEGKIQFNLSLISFFEIYRALF